MFGRLNPFIHHLTKDVDGGSMLYSDNFLRPLSTAAAAAVLKRSSLLVHATGLAKSQAFLIGRARVKLANADCTEAKTSGLRRRLIPSSGVYTPSDDRLRPEQAGEISHQCLHRYRNIFRTIP